MLDYKEYPILYVDDEIENLRIFEIAFGREFTILTAEDGSRALEIVRNEPVSLVLSDQKMPEMLGTELLRRVAELDPKTIRILVTAYGDAETLGRAINYGEIYRFVPKPWISEDMQATLRRGIEVYALDRERDQLLRELSLLNQVSKSINQELEFGPLVELLLETITAEFGYDAAGLILFEEKGDRLVWNRMVPEDDGILERLRAVDLSMKRCPELISRLIGGKLQVLSFSGSQALDEPVRSWITEVAAEEILVVPLVGSNRVIGAFTVDNRRGGREFTWEDKTLLEGLANQAAIAMENARLVADLRKSREQVMRFDRLGTLGTLAAGLAHEINNPLVTIHTFLSMAPGKRETDEPEFWSEYHSLASSEVDRIRRLVETMRQLGSENRGEMKQEIVDLTELGEQVLALLNREARCGDVAIVMEMSDSPVLISAVRDHMQQLLMNLILNAIDASGSGGSVELSIGLDGNDGCASVSVTDNGSGIPEGDLERIFDPFFTTKGPDKGTGLGLMICHRIVVDHGGTIEVQSGLGRGTQFCVRLPVGL